MKKTQPNLAEIVTLWGSVEAYNEEQRRTGLVELEARPFSGEPGYSLWSNLFKSRHAVQPQTRYAWQKNLNDGTQVVIRPLQADDERLMVKFHESLSESSVYYRWLTPLPLPNRLERLKSELNHLSAAGPDLELVADYWNVETGKHQIIGAASLVTVEGTKEADMGIIISDRYRRRGLGTDFIQRFVEVGHDRKLERLTGIIHLENRPMLQLCRKLNLLLKVSLEDRAAQVLIEL
jgi:acetyltransferase